MHEPNGEILKWQNTEVKMHFHFGSNNRVAYWRFMELWKKTGALGESASPVWLATATYSPHIVQITDILEHLKLSQNFKLIWS